MKRAILVVLDGVGIGALPDAAEYGDEGEIGMGTAVLLVVTNVGSTSHEEALAATQAAQELLTHPLRALARIWG